MHGLVNQRDVEHNVLQVSSVIKLLYPDSKKITSGFLRVLFFINLDVLSVYKELTKMQLVIMHRKLKMYNIMLL